MKLSCLPPSLESLSFQFLFSLPLSFSFDSCEVLQSVRPSKDRTCLNTNWSTLHLNTYKMNQIHYLSRCTIFSILITSNEETFYNTRRIEQRSMFPLSFKLCSTRN